MHLVIIGVLFAVAAVLCRMGRGDRFLSAKLKDSTHRQEYQKEQSVAYGIFGLGNVLFGLMYQYGLIGKTAQMVLLGLVCLVSVVLFTKAGKKYGA